VDVGFQLGRRAFQVAALHRILEARDGKACDNGQHRGDDRGFDQCHAGLGAARVASAGQWVFIAVLLAVIGWDSL